jgi:hypothetical protein
MHPLATRRELRRQRRERRLLAALTAAILLVLLAVAAVAVGREHHASPVPGSLAPPTVSVGAGVR